MSIYKTAPFPIRWYDCDVFKHMSAANYVRLLQEATHEFIASSELADEGCVGIPGQLHIKYSESLKAGDNADVEVEALDVSEGTFACAYRITNHASGKLSAEAGAVWKSYDLNERRGVAVQVSSLENSRPKENISEPGFEALQRLPAMPPRPVSFTRKVEWRDVDQRGIMTFAAYSDLMMEAALQGGEQFGWSMDETREAGILVVVRENWIQCDRPAFLRDDIEMTTWLSDFRRSTGRRNYTLRNSKDGKGLMRAQTLWAILDAETGLPARIPAKFVQDMQSHISQE
jgi:YbgC/YbaW family acyl-CoA thioester hydrolase